MELDASALLLTEAGKVRSDEDFIFYNQPASLTGRSSTRAACPVVATGWWSTPGRLPGAIDKVAFTASIHSAGHTFSQVGGAKIAVLQGGQPVVSYAISGLSTETGLVFGELYRRQGRGSSARSGRATRPG